MIRKFLDSVFSVKRLDGQSSRKVLTLLGVKIKFYDPKIDLYRRNVIQNRNNLLLLFNQLAYADEKDLFCIRGNNIIFIFNKGVLKLDYKFFQDYVVLFGFSNELYELIKPDKNSLLYKEHIARLKKGEFCWKYVDRTYYIGHSFISCEGNDIYINSSYVKEKDMPCNESAIRHVPAETKRKYIKGVTVGDYLKNKPEDFKVNVILKLLDYVFKTYADGNNREKVSGRLLDCHLYNFILGDDGKFYFVDFDLESTKSLDRAYCIFFMLYYYDSKLYKLILEKFGYQDKHHYYEKHFVKPKNNPKIKTKLVQSEEHRKLLQKYFTDSGILAQYEI